MFCSQVELPIVFPSSPLGFHLLHHHPCGKAAEGQPGTQAGASIHLSTAEQTMENQPWENHGKTLDFPFNQSSFQPNLIPVSRMAHRVVFPRCEAFRGATVARKAAWPGPTWTPSHTAMTS